jgi:hypothetical protein
VLADEWAALRQRIEKDWGGLENEEGLSLDAALDAVVDTGAEEAVTEAEPRDGTCRTRGVRAGGLSHGGILAANPRRCLRGAGRGTAGPVALETAIAGKCVEGHIWLTTSSLPNASI